MRTALILLLTLTAHAAEIRGTVIERGPNTPLPGATVSLFEFVPNGDTLDARLFKTISTDASGAFAFSPTHAGDFRLEVTKPGYVTPDEGPRNPGGDTFKLQIFLDERSPATNYRIALMIPASLTGRVVDEDRKPVANFRVFIQPADSMLMLGRGGTATVTNAEGVFTASPLPPGPYLVRVAAEGMQGLTISDYSEPEAQKIDEAFETSYWPGGVSDAKAALPLPVSPGTPANIGTIVLRKAAYYRANIELAGECTPGEQWTYTLIKLPQDPRFMESRFVIAPCRSHFLLRNLAPGAYSLAIRTDDNANAHWAQIPITITRENVTARFSLAPVTDLAVRFVAPEGKLPKFAPLQTFRPEDRAKQTPGPPATRIILRAEAAPNLGPFSGAGFAEDGSLVVPRLAWSRYSVSVSGVPSSHYIKEFRYNRQPLPDGQFSLAPGGLLEIVLGDRPASISGTVKDAPNVAVVLHRWPDTHPNLEGYEPYTYLAPLEPGGTFEFRGLAPGEYRIRAANVPLLDDTPGEGEKIILEAGDNKTVELKRP